MNGFLSWFKGNIKIKRWIVLILVGAVLTSFGVSKFITAEVLSFKDILIIILEFVFGFTAIVVGIIYMQKRTLEVFIEETNQNENNVDLVNSLIFDKKVYEQGPKIVVIGGGSGLNTVIRGLKKYTKNITAIVTVSETETKFNKNSVLNEMPIDNIKDILAVMSDNEEMMNQLLNYKFTDVTVRKADFGDVYLSTMQSIYGDFASSIEATKKVLNIRGNIIPVTMDDVKICAELDDETVIEGKNKIPEVVSEKTSGINRIYISPTNCKATPGVTEAILDADAIIIGPGSLYTNIIPSLLVKGVVKSIKESNAFKIFISNIMTEPGQTDNYSLADHIKTLIEHVGKGVVDYCIYDAGQIIQDYVRKYNLEGSELVEKEILSYKDCGIKFIQKDLSIVDENNIVHSSDAIATAIIELICDDMKFKDEDKDVQFVKLNSKLKEEKKKIKKVFKESPVKPKGKRMKEPEKKSKFYEKYKERMEGFKESDLKMKEKEASFGNEVNARGILKNKVKPVNEKKAEKKAEKKTTRKRNTVKKEKKPSILTREDILALERKIRTMPQEDEPKIKRTTLSKEEILKKEAEEREAFLKSLKGE